MDCQTEVILRMARQQRRSFREGFKANLAQKWLGRHFP